MYSVLSRINSPHNLRGGRAAERLHDDKGEGGVWLPPKNDDVIYEQPLRLKQLMEMTELVELLESLFLLWIDRADGPSGIGGMKGGN